MANRIQTIPTKQDKFDARGKSCETLARQILHDLTHGVPFSCHFVDALRGTGVDVAALEAEMQRKFEIWAQSTAWRARQIVAKFQLEAKLPDRKILESQ